LNDVAALYNRTTLQFDGNGGFTVSQCGGSVPIKLAGGRYNGSSANSPLNFTIGLTQYPDGKFNLSVVTSAVACVTSRTFNHVSSRGGANTSVRSKTNFDTCSDVVTAWGRIPNAANVGGGMTITVGGGSAMHVTEMAVMPPAMPAEQYERRKQQPNVDEPCEIKQRWIPMLAAEALAGAGAEFFPKWNAKVIDNDFKFGVGALHPGGLQLAG
jgi:hypothetical protein